MPDKTWRIAVHVLVVLAACSLPLVSCAGEENGEQVPLTPSAAASEKQAPSPEGDVFQVEVWVDQSQPRVGEPVVLHGSLIKHGVRLGAMTMEGYWPDPEQPSGIPNCRVQVIYGSGVCKVDTSRFSADQPVILQVKFQYEGEIFQGRTQIIPREGRD